VPCSARTSCKVISKRLLVIVFVITVLATATRLLLGSESSGRVELTVAMALLLVAIGVATGTLAGLLGIGGGVIMVPSMVVLFDMMTVVAKGTSVAVIVPTAIMGTIRNRRNANADIRVAAVVGAFGVVTAVIGGTISDRLSPEVANAMFAALLVFVAITQLLSLRSKPASPADHRHPGRATDAGPGRRRPSFVRELLPRARPAGRWPGWWRRVTTSRCSTCTPRGSGWR
jgi:uncharacterized protein